MNRAIDHRVLTLGPRSVERPADRGATLVAGLDGTSPAMVDGGGAVSPVGSGWAVDWWVGADDRWHVPAREPAVRQRRIGYGPVIETSLRVPSGDIIHTVYPVVVGSGAATVIEVRNESPVPVALALAIRPYPVVGPTPLKADSSSLRFQLEENVLTIDGRPAIVLPRAPIEAGASAEVDLLDAIDRGDSLRWPAAGAVGPSANGVCLYPLPHKTSLRFAIPAQPNRERTIEPSALADPESVANGWTTIVDQNAGFEFPDSGITALAGAARARLLMASRGLPAGLVDGATGAGLVLEGLAAGAHRLECRWALDEVARWFPAGLVGTPTGSANVVHGITAAAQLLGDDDLNQALLEPMTQLTHLVERARDESATDRARRGLAGLADLVEQPDAARSLRRGQVPPPPAELDQVMALAESAAPARRWNPDPPPSGGTESGPLVDSVEQAARFWLTARRLLLDLDPAPAAEQVDGRAGVAPSTTVDRSITVALLPGFPTAWRGGPVEVHRAPIAGALVSFAIRWHGYRPALLWDVAWAGAGPLRLTCPGLDPNWETTEHKGEVLLVGAADEMPPAPEPGDSFS